MNGKGCVSYVPGILTLRYIACPSIPRYVVSLRCFLVLASPFPAPVPCLQLTLFTPHHFYSSVPLTPSLSLCFSFATLCTRVKTIFLCLRAVMTRDIYSFLLLLTGFPILVLFLWACLFLISSQFSPLYIYRICC